MKDTAVQDPLDSVGAEAPAERIGDFPVSQEEIELPVLRQSATRLRLKSQDTRQGNGQYREHARSMVTPFEGRQARRLAILR